MNPDTRFVGRALDMAVARQVFGFQVLTRISPKTGKPDAAFRLGNNEWIRVPRYSTTRSGDFLLSIRLEDLGWKRKSELARAPWSAPAREVVLLEHADGRTVWVEGPVGVALCWAALKAVAL